MYNFLPHTEETRKEMLSFIGIDSMDKLFTQIPDSIRFKEENFFLPRGISELEAQKWLINLSNKNISATNSVSFLGGGCYHRFIPSCIATIVERSEFITAYTPYQPEVSQGTLQVIYEYQTMICNLTGMDVANASVYDGATAAAEAVLMAVRITNKNRVLIPASVNPDYARVIETYCYGVNIQVDYLPLKDGKVDIERLKSLEQDYACILVQTPNYFGTLENVYDISEIAKSIKAKFIACVDPVSLAILKSPSEYGADIVVGDIQPLGISMSFGGPHGGFIACKTEYIRQLPGRIAGMTKDKEGKTAFTLTLQAREQHIRRSKATSNICTNQALMALAASVYLSVTGPEGLKEAAMISTERAHYLAEKINQITGFSVLYNEFLWEFVVKVDEKLKVQDFLIELESKNILAGINLGNKFEFLDNCLLISVTEMNQISDIYTFIKELKDISEKYNLSAISKD